MLKKKWKNRIDHCKGKLTNEIFENILRFTENFSNKRCEWKSNECGSNGFAWVLIKYCQVFTVDKTFSKAHNILYKRLIPISFSLILVYLMAFEKKIIFNNSVTSLRLSDHHISWYKESVWDSDFELTLVE